MSEHTITTIVEALARSEQEGYPVLITVLGVGALDPLQARDERALRGTIEHITRTYGKRDLRFEITHTEKLLPSPRTPRHSSRPDW